MSLLALPRPGKNVLGDGRLAQLWRLASRSFKSLSAWWQRELLDLFENPAGRWLLGPRRRTLYLKEINGTIELRLTGDGSEPEATKHYSSYSTDTLDRFLSEKGLSRHDLDLVPLVPTERFFNRTLRLPEQTLVDLAPIIAKDLARKTTFKPEDIRDSYEVERELGSGKITVHHWIIRRSLIAQALAGLHLNESQVARIEGFGSVPRPCLVLTPATAGKRLWHWRAVRLLALVSLVLASSAFGLATWRKQTMITKLSAEIDANRAKAQSIRAQMDDLDKRQSAVMRVRSEKALKPSLSEVWEKATATLPVQSWLTEFQLTQTDAGNRDEQTLRLTGYSASAAELVTLFENSGNFVDPALTASVSIDPTEKRERFTLQMKVRNRASERTAQK